MSKQYTDAEKAEYWRKKAQRKGKKSYKKKKAYVPRSVNDSLAEQKINLQDLLRQLEMQPEAQLEQLLEVPQEPQLVHF